jgi:hypothetical protein
VQSDLFLLSKQRQLQSTAAAMQADERAHKALMLLLQHEVCQDISRENTTLIKLLATSKAVQAAASAYSGCVTLTYTSYLRDNARCSWYTNMARTMNREESFGAWLLKHMHLLKALHLKGTRPFFSDHNLAPALRAAAASEQGLRLVSFSSEDGINTVP